MCWTQMTILIGLLLLCSCCNLPCGMCGLTPVWWSKLYRDKWHPRPETGRVPMGTIVAPSGRLPTDLDKPVGSSRPGILADMRALWMMEFNEACLWCLHSLWRQLRPWVTRRSTSSFFLHYFRLVYLIILLKLVSDFNVVEYPYLIPKSFHCRSIFYQHCKLSFLLH